MQLRVTKAFPGDGDVHFGHRGFPPGSGDAYSRHIDCPPGSGSGQLEFEEFCTLAARFLVEEDTEAMQQELREAFRLYDKEGNGYITTDVFRDILHELDDKLSSEELDLMIEEIDADGSGTLDFDGIVQFYDQ
ncbi:hypothetical protein QAD02_012965 [Eretmocerus hayati]|uniref:Uncharacterized protein n=1 Tax=Eretmocerus hayati TaxID=131215 RepID=A0ACC2P250_9HYME|nr:hypothetical protein QAD02_012965 [Eretmocerus hayati]